MTIPGDNPLAYQGVSAPNPPNLIRATRAPLTTDINHDPGTFWLNEATNTMYVLVDISAGSATWDAFGGGSAGVDTINSLSPTGGNIVLAGTADEIDVASAGSTVTFSLPAALVAPGSLTTTTTLEATTTVTAGTGITATTGDITATAGNLVIDGAAQQLQVTGGAATDFIGQATLVAGTVTVANTNIAATDKIFLQRQGVGASTALGVLDVTINAGSDFVITSLQPGTPANTETNDVSIVDYFIVRQI